MNTDQMTNSSRAGLCFGLHVGNVRYSRLKICATVQRAGCRLSRAPVPARTARIIGLSQLPIARNLRKRETVAVGHSRRMASPTVLRLVHGKKCAEKVK